MIKNLRRSRFVIFFLIFAFILMTTSEGLTINVSSKKDSTKSSPVVKVRRAGPKYSVEQSNQFNQLMEEGKRLLKEWMDYKAAVQKFNEAKALAQTNPEKSDVYYYLSLAYFASLEEREKEFKDTLRLLIEVDYYRLPDENECPPQYIGLYNDVKREYGLLKILSNPPGADVYLNNNRSSAGKTPVSVGFRAGDVNIRVKKGGKQKKDTLTVVAGQSTTSPVYALAGGSNLIYYILGGAALVVGGGAALLLSGGEEEVQQETTGILSVKSQPEGAKIYIGSVGGGLTDSGQVTPYSFTRDPGNYEVRLEREGFQNYSGSATVTAGQTVNIDAVLTNHTITVTKPRAGDKIASKDNLKIKVEWDIDSASTQHRGVSFIRTTRAFANLPLPFSARAHMQNRRAARSRNGARIGSRGNPKTGNIQVQVNSALTRLSRYQAVQARRPEVARAPGSPASTPHAASQNFSPGQGMETSGTSQVAFLDKVSIYLLSGENFDTSQLIVSGINATKGSYPWNVQDSGINLKVGQYKIEVESESTDPLAVVSGQSGMFDIVEAQYRFDNYTIPKQMDKQSGPYGLATDSKGNFYIAVTRDIDAGDSKKRIVKINRQGVQIDDWPSKEPYQLVVVQESGKEFLYAAESTGRRAVKYDLNGNEIRGFSVGSRDPRGVAVDAAGNVYVSTYADQGGGRLYKFKSNGVEINNVSTNATKAMHMAVVGSNVYIAARHSHQILVYSTNLKYKGQIPAEYYPCGLAADSQNYLYVTYEDPETGEEGSYGTTRVEKINADTQQVATQLGYGYGSTNERYLSPTAVTLDQSGNVYVLEGHHSLNFRITRWIKK
jgi:hypothetical protein